MSNSENKDLPLPQKEEGAQKDIEVKEELNSVEEAKLLFDAAKKRLLNVNSWDEISAGSSATFFLTDENGVHIEGEPKVGDHFKIDIPAPGTTSGKGFDWVRVEAIEEETKPDREFVLMRVRPSDNPLDKSEDVSHFFSDKSTSNFLVLREGKVVTAAVLGRNEVPNVKEAEGWFDKLRNAIVGSGAVAGFSNPQWKNLVKGLLGKK